MLLICSLEIFLVRKNNNDVKQKILFIKKNYVYNKEYYFFGFRRDSFGFLCIQYLETGFPLLNPS